MSLYLCQREATLRGDAENAERKQRQWLETTLSSIGDGVIATDARGRVTFLNGVAQSLKSVVGGLVYRGDQYEGSTPNQRAAYLSRIGQLLLNHCCLLSSPCWWHCY